MHPGSLPLPPLIAREIPWQCRCLTDYHHRWDDSEPALEQAEQEETCISVSWKQTDRHVGASSTDPWRKAEGWKAQWWSVHPGAPASSLTTRHSRAAQPPGGTRTRWPASARLSRPGRGTQHHEAFLLFTTAPGRAVREVASCFTINGKAKFNLRNWTRKYKVQLNFMF